jgi:hypothetical protein
MLCRMLWIAGLFAKVSFLHDIGSFIRKRLEHCAVGGKRLYVHFT